MKHLIHSTTLAVALVAGNVAADDHKKPVRRTESTSTQTSIVSNDGKTEGTVTVTINKDGNTEVKTWKIGTPTRVQVNKPITLRSTGKMEKATWLGIAITDVSDDLRTQLPIVDDSGIRVRSVVDNSPAQKAGLKADDLIYKVDEQIIFNIPQFQSLVRTYKPGSEVDITFFRKGKQQTVTAKPILKEMLVDSPVETPIQFTQPGFSNWRRMETNPDGTRRFIVQSHANEAKQKIEAHRRKIDEWIKSPPKNRAFIVRSDGSATYVDNMEKIRTEIRNSVEKALKDAKVSDETLKKTLRSLDSSFKQPSK